MNDTETWGTVLDPNEPAPARMPAPVEPSQDQSVEDDSIKSIRVNKKRSEKIMLEARKRAARCMTWESETRARQRTDYMFAEGDSDNGWQWPDKIRQDREKDNRPYLTINKIRQHCLQIINDGRQNKPSIKFRAVGGGATFDSAQVWEGLARHIEYRSNASDAYDTASEHQVKMGIGYWLVTTDYEDPESFDQDIYIRRVKDPFSVFLDPDINERDGSDASYGFIIKDMLKEDFLAEYPQFADETGSLSLPLEPGWVEKDSLKVVQYYRRVEEEDELLSFVANPQTGERQTSIASKLSKEIVFSLKQDPFTKTRRTSVQRVEWFLIAGNRVIEERPWPGKYIPIVRIVGEEAVIDGKLDRKGHVRPMKDSQRMYNYWSSSAVENVALQSKTPYTGPAAAFEGYEDMWKDANKENYAYLPYNHRDDDGQEIPRPERAQPVNMPDAYIAGMKIASEELMMVSGQFQSQMGQQGNEVSGKAIGERQRQGDNATYHYIDGLSAGIRYTGRIVQDLIPHIYDTRRVLRILNEDGTEAQVQIDPTMDVPYKPGMDKSAMIQEQMQRSRTSNAIMHVLNPSLGKYEVYADVGPAYSTRRQEAFNAYTQIITQAPQLTALIGDILLKAGDFPMSDEAAQRLRRMVPLQALGDAPPPEMIALQQQVANLTQSLASAIQALGDKTAEMKVAQEKVQIDVYKADTDRLAKVLEVMSPEALEEVVKQAVLNALSSNGLADVERTSEAFLAPPEVPDPAAQMLGQEDPSIAQPLLDQYQQAADSGSSLAEPLGSTGNDATQGTGDLDTNQVIQELRQARDGQYYLPDPNRPGKYLQAEG